VRALQSGPVCLRIGLVFIGDGSPAISQTNLALEIFSGCIFTIRQRFVSILLTYRVECNIYNYIEDQYCAEDIEIA
jgi:hypothetical protein